MARGKTLVKLLDDLRAETRGSLNPAHNSQVRDTQVKLLQRTQEWLWEDYDWPHLMIYRQYPAQAGQRYYDFGADFDLERIESVKFKTNGAFHTLSAGITEGHFSAYDSDLDQRAWPVCRWRLFENDQVEVHPIADKNGDPTTFEGYFKVSGIKKLSPLVADNDRADLDDRMIVLYAAAEVLGGRGTKDAQIKLNLANDRKAALQGALTKQIKFAMFGIGRAERPRRPAIHTYRPPE
jgi:hypothetical protein